MAWRHSRPNQFFVPYNGKIADITHADTVTHLLVLANGAGTEAIAGETRKIVAVELFSVRIAGTGVIFGYPNEGTFFGGVSYNGTFPSVIVVANGTQRLQYALEVANDDFDLYCIGYVVEA